MSNLPIGVSSIEGIANGTPQLPSNDRYNVGVIMARERGVPNKAIEVLTIEEDRRKFGGVVVGATNYGALVVRNMFNNAGTFGMKITGVRVVGAGSAAAAVDVVYTPATVPAWLTTTLVAHASGVKAIKKYTPQNVQIGDTFSFGDYDVVVANTSPRKLVQDILALVRADVANDALQTIVDVAVDGDSIIVTHKTANTAISLVVAASAPTYASTDIGTIKAGQRGSEDPGVWANGKVAIKLHPYGALISGKFSAEIFYNGAQVDVVSRDTPDEIVEAINAGSDYVMWADYVAGKWVTTALTLTLTGGVYNAPTEANFYAGGTVSSPTGLKAFEGLRIPIITCTDFFTLTMAIAGRDFCANNRSIYIASAPQFANDAAIDALKAGLQTASEIGSHVVGYLPWVKTDDERGSFAWCPALGWAIGSGWVRNPQLFGDFIHIAPAGETTTLTDAIDVSPQVLSQATIDSYVKDKTINVSVSRRGKGTFFISSRTYSTNPLYHSAHVRRYTNDLLYRVEDLLEYAQQRTGSPELRIELIGKLTAELRSDYENGALERSVPFDVAAKVISDLSNNPIGGNRKDLYIDLLFIPSECIEAIRIRINRNDGVLSATVVE